MADKWHLTERVTQDGRTYQPGDYDIIETNDNPRPGAVTTLEAAKLRANYPGQTAKPKAKPKRVTKK